MAPRIVANIEPTPGLAPDNPGWECATWDDGDHCHVLPLHDLIEHAEDDDGDCVCGPSVSLDEKTDGTPYWLITHDSLDGREAGEP